MRTLIVGAGVIGVIYGWVLSQADVDVTHFVCPDKKEQFKDGITLDLSDVCALSTKELYKLCELRGVDLKKFPEVSFVNFPLWLISILVRWNIRRNESAQHTVSRPSILSGVVLTYLW